MTNWSRETGNGWCNDGEPFPPGRDHNRAGGDYLRGGGAVIHLTAMLLLLAAGVNVGQPMAASGRELPLPGDDDIQRAHVTAEREIEMRRLEEIHAEARRRGQPIHCCTSADTFVRLHIRGAQCEPYRSQAILNFEGARCDFEHVTAGRPSGPSYSWSWNPAEATLYLDRPSNRWFLIRSTMFTEGTHYGYPAHNE